MSAPVLLMEEHHEAYFAWKAAGIRDAWCWHVDAHLDIGRDDLHPGESRLGNPFVPWGGLNCGNYLWLAIQEGIVSRLTWVIPPDLPGGPLLLSWARDHLNGWLDMTVAESAGLTWQDGCVQGTLLGIPFQMGVREKLPPPDRPVLLDIDLDYYVTQQGELWSEPSLEWPPSLYTTVAWSVKGGYLPASLRRLAAPWTSAWEGYAPDGLDAAAGLIRLKRYEEALACADESVEGLYLRGTAFHHLKRPQEALETWQRLLTLELPPAGRAYVLGLAAEASVTLGRADEALRYALEAQKHTEPDYRLCWVTAGAYEGLGELRQATQMLRRGLRLAEPYVFGLQMRAVLARLYRQQGKEGLARLELEQLARADLGGQFRPLHLLR